MKTESVELTRQRETKCHEERAREGGGAGTDADTELSFTFYVVVLTMLVRRFYLHSFAFGVRPFFQSYSKMGPQISAVFSSSCLVFN